MRRFTKEDELILQGDIELSEITALINGSYFSVYSRRKRLIDNGNELRTKAPICPNCGSKDCNPIQTLNDVNKLVAAHYCINCLHEFIGEEIIRPLF